MPCKSGSQGGMSRPWKVYDEISGSGYCGATVH